MDSWYEVVENLPNTYGKGLYKLAERYGYTNRYELKSLLLHDLEESYDAEARKIQYELREKIMGQLLESHNRVRFEDCEEAYYGCDCAQPCD